MRKFVLPTVAALLLATASPAAAADWTVTPGGDFVVLGGEIVMQMAESGLQYVCASVELQGVATAGTGGNPVATFPESPDAPFTDCSGTFIEPYYRQLGDWEMHAESYDPVDDTVSGTIQNVAFEWYWAGCNAIFTGSLNYLYRNSSGQLVILPDATLTVSYVDPVNQCLGLVLENETASLDNTSTVVPPQQIVPA